MADVVVDENIYIRALLAECTGASADRRAAAILVTVQEHHRWVISHDILAAYLRQFSRVDCRGSLTTQLMKSVDEALSDTQRSLYLSTIPTVTGSYSTKDGHVVSAAAASPGSLLVTMDERLAGQLEGDGIPRSHDFRVVGLVAAEGELLPRNL